MKQLVAFQGLSSCFFHMNEWMRGKFSGMPFFKGPSWIRHFQAWSYVSFSHHTKFGPVSLPPTPSSQTATLLRDNRLSSFTHTLSSIPFGWKGKGKNETSTFFSFKSCLKQESQKWKPISSGNYKEKSILIQIKFAILSFFKDAE